jgi:hypothetical protein
MLSFLLVPSPAKSKDVRRPFLAFDGPKLVAFNGSIKHEDQAGMAKELATCGFQICNSKCIETIESQKMKPLDLTFRKDRVAAYF